MDTPPSSPVQYLVNDPDCKPAKFDLPEMVDVEKDWKNFERDLYQAGAYDVLLTLENCLEINGQELRQFLVADTKAGSSLRAGQRVWLGPLSPTYKEDEHPSVFWARESDVLTFVQRKS